jgi:hypothetical protein
VDAVIAMVIGDDFSVAMVEVDVAVPSHVQNRWQFGKIGTTFMCATPWCCARTEFMKTANNARTKNIEEKAMFERKLSDAYVRGMWAMVGTSGI